MAYLTRETWSAGATPPERNALFNGAACVTIHRDADSRGRLRWFPFLTGGPSETVGTSYGPSYGCDTLGDALSLARSAFPSLPAWRTFLERVEGRKAPRALYMPQTRLEALERGSLALDSQDIAAALEYVQETALRASYLKRGDISGAVTFLDASGADIAAIFVTDSSRPFDGAAPYWRAC